MMEYKGYQASYKFDEEEGAFIGDVVNIADIIFSTATLWSSSMKSFTSP